LICCFGFFFFTKLSDYLREIVSPVVQYISENSKTGYEIDPSKVYQRKMDGKRLERGMEEREKQDGQRRVKSGKVESGGGGGRRGEEEEGGGKESVTYFCSSHQKQKIWKGHWQRM
jgi:hypothetical protein